MIRLANPSDLDAIAEIYEEILAAEDARPASYTNWQRGKYPTRDTAEAALEAGTLWVGEEDGAVYGCVNLNGEQLPEYDAIPWSVPAQPSEVGVIHTLVIRPSWSGRGRPGNLWPSARRSSAARGKRRSDWIPMREISLPTPCTPAWATPSRGPPSFSSRGLFMKF